MGTYNHVEALMNAMIFLLRKMDPGEADKFDVDIIKSRFNQFVEIIEEGQNNYPKEDNDSNNMNNYDEKNEDMDVENIIDTTSSYTGHKESNVQVDSSIKAEEEEILKEIEDNNCIVIDFKRKDGKEQEPGLKFKCFFCEKEFDSQESAENHDKYEHMFDGKSYKCPEDCEYTIGTKMHMVEHVARHHRKIPCWNCNQCGELFFCGMTLRRHVQKKHEPNMCSETCPLCLKKKKVFRRRITDHLLAYHTNIESECDICGKSYSNPYSLKLHTNIYHKEGGADLVSCDVCGKSVIKAYLKRHLKYHDNEDNSELPYPCSKCDLKYRTQGRLNEHFRENHKNIFLCGYCDFQTTKSRSYKQHVASHLNERKYACDQCDKRFNLIGALKNHKVQIHSEERKFKCDQCDKSFKVSYHLKIHRKIHSKEYAAHCDICNKSFIQQYNYKMHLRKMHS